MLCLFVSGVNAQNDSDSKTPTVLKTGDVCPDFSIEDIEENPRSLRDFKGKYLFIDVWASWCHPCIDQQPFLKKMAEELKNKNIVFLSLSIDDAKWRWQGAVQGYHFEGIQWHVQNKDFEAAFGIDRIPRCIVLDPDGKVVDPSVSRPSDPKTKEFLLQLKGI